MRKLPLLYALLLFSLIGTAHAQTIISASGDAYVEGGTSANTNFGGATDLYVKNNGDESNLSREAYFQFDLSSLTEVESVKLRLYALSSSAENQSHQASSVSDDWTEGSITWANRPKGGTVLGSWTVGPSQSVEIDVTSHVRQSIQNDDNVLSVRVYRPTPATGTNITAYASREHGTADFRPKLIVNRAPRFTSEPELAATRGKQYLYEIIAEDADGDELTIAGPTLPAWLSLVDHGDGTATLSGTPGPEDVGDHDVVLTVSDGQGTPGQQAFTVTVAEHNPPQTVNDEAYTNEDTPVDIPVLANDIETDRPIDVTSVELISSPASGAAVVNPATGVITYTPGLNFAGILTFHYTVRDDAGALSEPAVVMVVVNPVNDAPVAIDDAVTTQEEVPVTIDVLANDIDVDGDELEVTAIDDVVGGAATNQGDGTIRFVPEDDFFGTASFTYTVSDGNGETDQAEVTITVTNVQDKPVAVNDEAKTSRNKPITIEVLANDRDADGDALSIVSVSAPQHGDVVVVDNKVGYTPAAGFIGKDTFTYVLTDGTDSDQATVVVTVSGSDVVPVANDDEVTTEEDVPVKIDVLANDTAEEGDTLTISIVKQPERGSAVIDDAGTPEDPTDDQILYTPAQDFAGADTLAYKVSNQYGDESATAEVIVTVTPVNDAPSMVELMSPEPGAVLLVGGTLDEPVSPGTPFIFEWAASTDPDGDELTYTWYLTLADSLAESTILHKVEVGNATRVELDYGTIAGLLDEAGVALDSSIVLYYIVAVSDGELSSSCVPAGISLTRGVLTGVDGAAELPSTFVLDGNYPNPFNPTTTIRFSLPVAATVRVDVYDVAGRRVLTLPEKEYAAGANQTIMLDATNLVSGLYIYRVVATGGSSTFSGTGRMVMLK